MLCCGNLKIKLLERCNYCVPSINQKDIKRHMYLVLAVSQPHQLPAAKLSSPHSFSRTNSRWKPCTAHTQLPNRNKLHFSAPLLPFFVILWHATQPCLLQQTVLKMLESYILFVHIRCKNIFTDVLFKHFSWVEKHVIILLNQLQQHKYVIYIHIWSRAPMLVAWILGAEARAGVTENAIISNVVRAFNASSWSSARNHNNLAIPVSFWATVQ